MVMNDCTVGWILTGGLLRGQRRIGPFVAPEAVRQLRLEQLGISARGLGVELTQRRHVVEDPERSPVRTDHNVVVVDHQITDRGRRHVEPKRLPVLAVVE